LTDLSGYAKNSTANGAQDRASGCVCASLSLVGLFDGPSTARFDPTLPMVSLDLSRVTENATLISVLMTCASAWMESALLDPNGGQRWVVYDEAWRLMSHPAAAATHGCSVAAGASLRHREHADLP